MTLPKNVDDLYQLSPMQHLMLLRAIAEEGSGVLLNQVCYDVRGPFDVENFRLAWETLVARHPALRTAFLWEGLPHPVQVVRSTVPLDFSVIDLSAMPPDERTAEAERLQRADARNPLTLGRAPLMRCTVLRLGDDHHRFLWTIHHLVIDRWSHAILLGELCDVYVSRVTGVPAPLAPAPPYRDYVAWIARQDRAEAARYWQEVVGDIRHTTRMGEAVTHGHDARATTSHAVSHSASEALRERAVRWRVTPGAVLQAAIGLLLARRSAHADVVYGLTVSGRPPDLADASVAVGSFVNNVPVRLRLKGGLTVEALVREVHRTEGRRLPFTWVSPVQVQEWSAVPTGRPLFDTLILLNLNDDTAIKWPGLEFVSMAASLDAGYPFLLAVGTVDGAYAFSLVHDAGFGGAAQLLAELEQLVAQVATAGDRTIVGDLVPSLTRAASTVDDPAPPRAAPSPASAASPSATLTSDDLAESLLQAWREVLGIEELGLDDDFFAVGGTSMQAAQLFARIERIAGRTLPLSTLFEAGSVRAFLAGLDRPLARSSSLVRVRSSGRRPTLYAVPGIGGNIVSLSGLARHLGADQPFSAFESPGLDGREAPLTSIEAIAARYVDELLRTESDAIHLLGICWGAAVAFEMGRLLGECGVPAASLALMDPAVLLRESPTQAARGDSGFVRERLELYWDEFRAGNWRDRSRLLANKARRVAQALAGNEAREKSAHERALFRVREANTRAVTCYNPLPYQGVARIFLTTDRDLGGSDDPRLAWLSLIQPKPDIVAIRGVDSGDAISPAHVGEFASALRAWMDDTARADA